MEIKSKKSEESYKVWVPLVFALASIIGLLGGYKMAGNDALNDLVIKSDQENGFTSGRVEELVRFIESKYVNEVNSDELIADAFQNVLDHLDPHSIYLKPEDIQQLNDQMDGSFEGIGIESILLDDTLYVNHVIKDSPGHHAGLKSGDQILAINDSIVAGESLTFTEIRDKLKGNAAGEINLKVRSFKDSEIEDKTIVIGEVDVKTVQGFLKDSYAIVRIERFSSDSYREFMDCLGQLHEKGGFKHLILDLRGNPGGFLPEATNMLNQIFKEKGRLLVYTQGRKDRISEYKSTGKNFYDIDKVAVLVDEGSASGSEIIAGAIQDWDRGLIVGRRTFGKGLVQEQYTMSNGGALRLTVAEYFTPSGRLIQKAFDDARDYRDDIANRIMSGELSGESAMPIMDSTQFKTKLKKRIVYAGGGISPDIYIPLDSVKLSPEIIRASSLVDEFVFRRFLKDELTVPDSADTFISDFDVSDEILSQFRGMMGLQNADYSELESYFSKLIKREVAKLYFGRNLELQVDFENDDFLHESIFALNKQNIFAELK